MNTRHDSDKNRRRSLRLQGYDYTQEGAYFVTVCLRDRVCLFGDISDGKMILNDVGMMAEKHWRDIPAHFPHIELDEFVIMPNHVHGILSIITAVGAKNFSPLHSKQMHGPSKTIGSVIRGFKIGVTKWMRQNTLVYNVWQRNYYEHVIRDDASLNLIRQYIMDNPSRWAEDEENPAVQSIKRDIFTITKGGIMKAIVVYESMWGNTAAIARAIAEGIGPEARALSTAEATAEVTAGADLIVAGAPLHAFRLSTEKMRKDVSEDPKNAKNPADISHPLMRTWLAGLPKGKGKAAAFETRFKWSPGGAAESIMKGLKRAGYSRAGKTQKFLVTGVSGPMKEGEAERAKEWGGELAKLTK